MVASPTRTTTSYALLGLLSLRSWTTYELAKQVQRSLNWFWPRAERKLYDEPKQLAALGLAVTEERFTGRRRSRAYTITDEGRADLRRWLDEPPAPRLSEFEGMVKVFFADAGDLEQLRATLDRIETEALDRLGHISSLSLEPRAFPERAHLNALCLRLQLEQEQAVLTWVRWARLQVRAWVDTGNPGGWDAAAVLRALAHAAEDVSPPRTG